jgi:hypothetical protein
MVSEFPGELWPNRNQAGFEELDLFGQIDVLQCQMKGFANAHATPVQQQEERTKHSRHLRAVPDADSDEENHRSEVGAIISLGSE